MDKLQLVDTIAAGVAQGIRDGLAQARKETTEAGEWAKKCAEEVRGYCRSCDQCSECSIYNKKLEICPIGCPETWGTIG